jgi:hypothetical protein
MKTSPWRPTSKNLKSFFTRENSVIIALLFVGFLLRIRQYLTGRSLWIDEAMLALNIVNRDFAGLFKPLDYDQGTPLGFLLVEKLFNVLLGKNELVLRLLPLMVGLAALWLFYLLLKRTTSGAGLLIALALFALNPRLVYYSSEVKQYILDVAVTIGLLLMAEPLFSANPSKKGFVWFSLAGLLALWFSHPALFVLAGIGLTLILVYLQKRDYPSLRLSLGMGIAWVINLAVFYLLVLKDLRQNNFIHDYWQDAFVPLPPWGNLGWYLTSINKNISLQFGLPYLPLLVFGIMLVGWVVLWRHKREYALAFAFILLVTLTASALQLYPVLERMILFLIPIGSILLGKAADALNQGLSARPILNFGIMLAFSLYLLYGPFTTSLDYFIQPKYYEHIRPAMAYLQEKVQEGDGLYVSYGAVPAFRFYAPGYGLEKMRYESGERDDYQNPQLIQKRLDTFKGQRRVWVLISHVYEQADFNERDFIVTYLDRIGIKRREIREPDTSVYLYFYDLGNP